MAPYTYVGLALAAAPGGCIHFGSLEFADTDGPALIPSLVPGQALHFGDLDFIDNHLGQLCLRKGNVAPPHIPTLNTDHTTLVPLSLTLMR